MWDWMKNLWSKRLKTLSPGQRWARDFKNLKPGVIREIWKNSGNCGRPQYIIDFPGETGDQDYTVGACHPFMKEEVSAKDIVLISLDENGLAEVFAKITPSPFSPSMDWSPENSKKTYTPQK